MDEDGPWVSATDLADYAFCPRSHWYHDHPPIEGPTPEGRRRTVAGTRYHQRVLRGEQRRADHGGAYWVAFAGGALLVIGGIAWIFHP